MKPVASLALILVVSLPVGPAAASQSSAGAGCQPSWQPTFGIEPGVNDNVEALAVFDDGGGGGPALYAAGSFTSAGGIPADFVARWDGSRWSPVGSGGSGMNSRVLALAVFDDGSGGGPALYAAGLFTTAGGAPANRIAKWDGVRWSALGNGLSSVVRCLAVFDDGNGNGPALYAGGDFSAAGSASAAHIAKWDGSTWSPVGSGGSGMNGAVLAMTAYDDNSGGGPALYAGGSFTLSGGVPTNGIAKWNGSSWSGLVGGGTGTTVFALTSFDDGSGGGPALFVGAQDTFTTPSGVTANGIAKWNGSIWFPVGSGVAGKVTTLTVFDDGGGPALIAAGFFTSAGGGGANSIAKWNGSSWSSLGSGVSLNPRVRCLITFDDGGGGGAELYVGGHFGNAGGTEAWNVAKWSGSSWSSFGEGFTGLPTCLEVFDDGNGGGPALFVGGAFTNIGSVQANYIAKWDGANWSPLGSGVDATVAALAVFDDGKGGGPALVAAGGFTNAGGAPAAHVAKWDGANWSALGSGLAGGFSGPSALTVFDDGSGGGPALYVGGSFSSAGGIPANNIARWDGVNWSALGNGLVSILGVRALTVFDDGAGPALHAGGYFTTAVGAPANYVAKWNGAVWSPLGSGGGGTSGSVRALTTLDDGSGNGTSLFAGGDFVTAGGVAVNSIAKWDGASWSALASGVSGGLVAALTTFDDGSGPALYAGGNFTGAGGTAANRIARWGGSGWSALGAGVSGLSSSFVGALEVFDDGSGPALFAGGAFSTSGAGDSNLAKWGCPSSTPVTGFCTAKTTLVCGAAKIEATGTSSASATSGFVIRAGPVVGCRAGLLLTSDQPVRPGVSFGGPGDGRLCLSGSGLFRAGPIDSGGTPTLLCDGVLSLDVNQFNTRSWTPIGCNPATVQISPAGFLGNMGATVSAQMWGKDSGSTGRVLSDGISWVIGP